MIAAVAWKEARELMRDGRVRVIGGAVVVLAVAALIIGVDKQAAFARELREAEERSRLQWESQGERNPHTAAHFGLYVNAAYDILAFVDPGLIPYLGRSVWLEAHSQNPMKYRPIEDAPSLARFGELSLTLVLQQVVPLFLILLGYTAFASERDRGTLRSLLAANLPRRVLLLGKALGIAGCSCMVLAPLAAIAAVAILLGSTDRADTGARLGVLAVTYTLYYGTVLAVTLAVSAVSRNTRSALVGGLAIWVTTTFLVPKVAADLADRLHPPPSAASFWASVDAELGDAHGNSTRTKALEQKVLAQYDVRRLDDLPVNFDGIALQDGEEHANEVFDAHYGALFDTYDAQSRWLRLSMIAAPIMGVRAISMALAGTDIAQHRAFVLSAEEYRRQTQRLLNGYLTQRSTPGQSGVRAGSELWRSLARFQPGVVPLSDTIETAVPLVLGLAAWLAAASAFAVLAVRRVSPL